MGPLEIESRHLLVVLAAVGLLIGGWVAGYASANHPDPIKVAEAKPAPKYPKAGVCLEIPADKLDNPNTKFSAFDLGYESCRRDMVSFGKLARCTPTEREVRYALYLRYQGELEYGYADPFTKSYCECYDPLEYDWGPPPLATERSISGSRSTPRWKRPERHRLLLVFSGPTGAASGAPS